MDKTFNDADVLGDDTIRIYSPPDESSLLIHRTNLGYDHSVVISRAQWDWLLANAVPPPDA